MTQLQWRLLTGLTLKSIWNRRFTAGLTLFSLALSVLLLLSIETLRSEARQSFTNTVSGTDLLVGARSGSLPLLLYSVFHLGNASNNIDWRSYMEISGHPAVAWSIPLSLGDSHRGFRVIGTTGAYFEYFRFGREQALQFASGAPFSGVYDAVIGADVAAELGYQPGSHMILAHGVQDTHFSRHEDKPFTVSGVLAKTGTPVDRSILVSLAGIEALHIDWQSGTRSRQTISAEAAQAMDLQPKQITAFMLGLHSKLHIFQLQRAINGYKKEPLQAILPGVALGELWQLLTTAENILFIVSACVLINSLIVMLVLILSGLNARRRELAVLRALGARPAQLFILLSIESVLFGVLACILGLVLYYLGVMLLAPLLHPYGVFVSMALPNAYQWSLLGGVLGLSTLLGLVPAIKAYRYALNEGLSIRD
ncbi:MAG: FtsX-like permease family protein [Oleiphilaceae bacterium]|nr:FtsX-like permease family protein [Oleiphilaceae bacterium]